MLQSRSRSRVYKIEKMIFLKFQNIQYIILILCFSQISLAQKTIKIKADKIILYDRNFFISEIIDVRKDTGKIGVSADKQEILIEQGLKTGLMNYFAVALPKEHKKQIPVIMKINKFLVTEETEYSEIATAIAEVEFLAQSANELIRISKIESEIRESGQGIGASHEKRIRFIIYDCLKKFNDEAWNLSARIKAGKDNKETASLPEKKKEGNRIIYDNESAKNKENIEKNRTRQEDDMVPLKQKNIFAAGFLLGGFCIAGFEYEIRVHNYVGLNFGAGYPGFTGGIKIHTGPSKDSHFFNISFKDFYYGLMNAAGIEWGGRWVFREGKKLGLLYQFGLVYQTGINKDLEKLLYNGKAYSKISPFFGVGLSW